jgi:hypothetical protein
MSYLSLVMHGRVQIIQKGVFKLCCVVFLRHAENVLGSGLSVLKIR